MRWFDIMGAALVLTVAAVALMLLPHPEPFAARWAPVFDMPSEPLVQFAPTNSKGDRAPI